MTEVLGRVTKVDASVYPQVLHDVIGVVDSDTMAEVDEWLRDFLSLPER